ncbi:hypothetical protein MRX96_044116 [Rhipicephalus microplus]
MSRDYLNPQQERCSKGCFKCGEEGHTSGECSNLDAGGVKGKDFSENRAQDAHMYAEEFMLKTVLVYKGTSAQHHLAVLSQGRHFLVAAIGLS